MYAVKSEENKGWQMYNISELAVYDKAESFVFYAQSFYCSGLSRNMKNTVLNTVLCNQFLSQVLKKFFEKCIQILRVNN